MFGNDGDNGDDEMPGLEYVPPHPNPNQYPAAADDPEEADISNFNFVRVGPGRFNVQATITRSVSPQDLRGMAPGSIGGFMSILNGLTGTGLQQGQAPGQGQPQRQPQGQGEGLFSGAGRSAYHETQGQDPGTHTGRFTYHGGARLSPRGDGQGMRVEPVDNISK